ncbi:MAG: pyruvate dehydrogenase (acetyl-transferring), homodimeric type, partial [Chloracidobacterium sp.]|nr:pyruvate dehydrogenase (acetyl-transferring), homodimeric type [Chloracidobacterium sp.]
ILAEQYNIQTDVWSVTSYNELRRDALRTERWNRLHPTEAERRPYIVQALRDTEGPIVASTDYMKIVPDQIAPWLGGRLTSLGTDGFGRSDSREHLRGHFEINAESMVAATLSRLAREGKYNTSKATQAMIDLGLRPEAIDPSLA